MYVTSIALPSYICTLLTFHSPDIEPWEASPPVPGCKMVLLRSYTKYTFIALFIFEAGALELPLADRLINSYGGA
jgi:hypothetical protein